MGYAWVNDVAISSIGVFILVLVLYALNHVETNSNEKFILFNLCLTEVACMVCGVSKHIAIMLKFSKLEGDTSYLDILNIKLSNNFYEIRSMAYLTLAFELLLSIMVLTLYKLMHFRMRFTSDGEHLFVKTVILLSWFISSILGVLNSIIADMRITCLCIFTLIGIQFAMLVLAVRCALSVKVKVYDSAPIAET